MSGSDFYDLPRLVGEQYMLTTIIRETRDTIFYRATQRELRRDVIVESLRHSAMGSQRKVGMFLDSARAQAFVQGGDLTCVLQVIEADGTWLIAKENPAGDALDQMLTDGKRISALDLCQLMISLCRICLRLDKDNIASARFHLEDVYYYRHRFKLNNPALAGTRAATTTRVYLADASRDLLPLLDSKSHMAGTLASLMKRTSMSQEDSTVKTALLLAELSRLHTLMLQPPKEETVAAEG